MSKNIDAKTVASFGYEWERHSQAEVGAEELSDLFDSYFKIFPWDLLPVDSVGFDMGCGSGRWAKFVAPKVGTLNCIDPSARALDVARSNLAHASNVVFLNNSVDAVDLPSASQDFGYSLGVLHHVPDTAAAIASSAALLKPGAPLLLYLYYRFDNRPSWFRMLWALSNVVRSGLSKLPHRIKSFFTDIIAVTTYYPLARLARVLEKSGFQVEGMPLSAYRNLSFYTMRTDSLDRFGTPLEQRFTRIEIADMMSKAGLNKVQFHDGVPYWCAIGFKV